MSILSILINVVKEKQVIFTILAVLEELVGTERLKGNVLGGRQDKAVYIPDIYAKTQNNWVDSFLHQNGYLGSLIISYLPFLLFLLMSHL